MYRILVVEDDVDLQYLYDLMLARQGYSVLGVENTTAAIERLSVEPFDLVILDMNMPDMPGIGLLEYLRDNPPRRPLPVVVISANELWERRVRDLGVDHFYVKPVSMDTFVTVVDRILNGV